VDKSAPENFKKWKELRLLAVEFSLKGFYSKNILDDLQNPIA